MSPEMCGGFAVDMETILGVDVTVVEEPFLDYLTERSGTGCWMHAPLCAPEGLDFLRKTFPSSAQQDGWADKFYG